MNKQYESPKVEVVNVAGSDIITTSGAGIIIPGAGSSVGGGAGLED